MNFINFRKIIRQAWWFAFIEINLSIMITVLSLAEVFTSQWEVFHSTAICGIIYVVVNIFRMRINFYELADTFKYYFYNLTAYGIFAVVSIALYPILDSNVYTWLFAVLKVFRYFDGETNTLFSAMVVHLVMIVGIICAPIGTEEMPDD